MRILLERCAAWENVFGTIDTPNLRITLNDERFKQGYVGYKRKFLDLQQLQEIKVYQPSRAPQTSDPINDLAELLPSPSNLIIRAFNRIGGSDTVFPINLFFKDGNSVVLHNWTWDDEGLPDSYKNLPPELDRIKRKADYLNVSNITPYLVERELTAAEIKIAEQAAKDSLWLWLQKNEKVPLFKNRTKYLETIFFKKLEKGYGKPVDLTAHYSSEDEINEFIFSKRNS